MEVYHEGIPLSLQEAYEAFLVDGHISVEQYQVWNNKSLHRTSKSLDRKVSVFLVKIIVDLHCLGILASAAPWIYLSKIQTNKQTYYVREEDRLGQIY